jgi:hypothetical protein
MKNLNKNMIKLHYGGVDHFFNEEDILSPGKHYEKLCNISSDINEHLPTLKRYASECKTVTEMGVRFACSTWAFLEGKPEKLNCYDINYEFFRPSEYLLNKMSELYNVEFEFITADSLKTDIENTDLLFIDTLHRYEQLIGELNKHHKNINKYIILHDTTLFEHRDEELYEHASDIVKNTNSDKKGLSVAIDDFLSNNKNWQVKEVYTNCNGLTILERKF